MKQIEQSAKQQNHCLIAADIKSNNYELCVFDNYMNYMFTMESSYIL